MRDSKSRPRQLRLVLHYSSSQPAAPQGLTPKRIVRVGLISILDNTVHVGAMVLGKLPVPGRPTILITVGQGPTALAVGAGGGLFGHFYSHLSLLSSFSLSLGDGPI